MKTSVQEEEGKVRTTITLPSILYHRIRRAMGVSKRNFSAEVEYAMEKHVEKVETEQDLADKHLRNDRSE